MDVSEFLGTLDTARKRSRDGDWVAAVSEWRRVVAANPVDGRNWDQLATACFAAGEFREALAAYQRVRRLGLHDDDSLAGHPGGAAYLMACCHTALGEHDDAFAMLADAMAAGFVQLDEAVADPRLAVLRADPRFAATLGLFDPAGLGRDEGWRADLDLLVREAHRRQSVTGRFDDDAELLRQAIPELTDAEVAAGMTKLLPLLDDGHAFLDIPSGELSRALPVQFYLFEEGVHITSAEPAHADLLGARVLAFDGTPVADVLRAVDAVICRDGHNDYRSAELAADWLRKVPILHAIGAVRAPDSVRITTADGDSVLPAVPGYDPRAKHFPMSTTMRQLHDPRTAPLYLRHTDKIYWFEVLAAQRMVYCQVNIITDDPAEPMAAFARRLADTVAAHDLTRLVLDLRWNRGGNTFLTPPLIAAILGCAELYLIVGRRTFSAAGNTASHLQWFAGPRLTVVGEPSGYTLDFTGETVPFTLPYSGFRCNISNLHWQGMTPLDRRAWIPPDIHTPPTFAAYRDNRDPAMAAVLATTPA